jgi:hypothetical protein
MWWKKSNSPTTQARRCDEVVRRRLGKGDVNKVHGINMAYCAFEPALV